jgi:hypothetical protein
MPILVQLHKSYSDEFVCEAFAVYDSFKEYKAWLDEVTNYITLSRKEGKTADYFFGTNEFLEFNSLDDLNDSITVDHVSTVEAEFLVSRFGKRFGTGDVIFDPDYL